MNPTSEPPPPPTASAGLVLAATFSALAVIPLLFLVQLAVIVAGGVLIDTFVVRYRPRHVVAVGAARGARGRRRRRAGRTPGAGLRVGPGAPRLSR